MPPKPQLTPEEKKAQKAAKAAETKRKKIEKSKQLKRDFLERELKYGNISLRRQERNWRQMLINITIPEMLKDLEFAWHNFERVVDCKDFKISLLLDELDLSNKQYFLNFKTQSEHIDQLIQMFNDRIIELQEDFNKQVEEIQAEHVKNSTKVVESSHEEECYLKTVLYILQLEMKEVKRTRHAEYFSKLQEQDSKQHQLIQTMRGILEQVHRQLWIDTAEFLNNHKHKIAERRKAHKELKYEDNKLQKLINAQLERIRRAYDTIRSLKLKKSELEKLLGRQVADLQSEFDFFTLAFNTLKVKLSEDRQVDFQKLNCLTIDYNEIISYLENLETKGKHILNVGTVCRKLETLEEKILPFPVNFINEMSKASVGGVPEYMEVLELFWQRVGKADALRYAVNEEREFLITENEILKRRLHHYCQCLKCPDYVPFKTKARPCLTVTEGALEMKKYLKHGVLVESFMGEKDEIVDHTHGFDLFSFTESESPLRKNK